jgi:hypothetical protein
VTLHDGRTIEPEDVLGPPARGAKLVVVGDTETTDGLSEHVRDADLLVIEATFLERDAAMALDYGHLTAAKAAELAAPGRFGFTAFSATGTGRQVLGDSRRTALGPLTRPPTETWTHNGCFPRRYGFGARLHRAVGAVPIPADPRHSNKPG